MDRRRRGRLALRPSREQAREVTRAKSLDGEGEGTTLLDLPAQPIRSVLPS